MVKVTTGTNEPINITVREGGAIRKEVSLPYQQYGVDVDLSFAAPLIRCADRNSSDGTPWFPQQLIEFWSTDIMTRITIPVFHCDETYWDTIGSDSALPQPPKPRIPNQTLDIYFPYSIHPSDAFQVEIEPVTGAPSDAIFPTTYVLGNTIDIKYIKKLTIKNVWGSGLDQVINYEDKLHTDVVYDESLQCALRARWNMRNGQWFWAAFKDYFWSNKFTPIRGRGGVTEQAEITINLEYGEEWYNVYQELLVSSNVVFELNLPGINQYQSKRFKAEVVGDTGARWSNSTKTYRQQVRFKTTELQDNYMFPLAPDQPPTPSIAFTAQKNPWTIGSAYAEGLTNGIYSNAAWEVKSEPSWLTVTNGVSLLTPDDFEQGSSSATPGLTWERAKTVSPKGIRLKKPFTDLNTEIYSLISIAPGYEVLFVYLNADGTISTNSPWISINGRVNMGACQQVGILIRKTDNTSITPADITTLSAYWGKRYHQFPAGSSNLTATVSANTGEARTGNIVLKSLAGSTTYSVAVTQAGVSGNISVDTPTLNVDYITHPVTIDVTSFGNWSVSQRDTWITPSVYVGPNGTTAVMLTIADNTGNAARTGMITFYNDLTGNIAIVTVNQAGAPSSISVTPSRVSGPKIGRNYLVRAVATSGNNWTMSSAPSWVSVTPTSGEAGQTTVGVKYDTANPGAARMGQLRIKNTVTNEIAICLITQEG
nr:MAG: putative binding domain protein [Bacteriophage sp.]